MTGPITAASYLDKSERALKDALMLLREEATEGACNRAYYAMHDAAHAALLAGGHEAPHSIIKTHHGLIAEFGRQLVQSGQLAAELGRDFNRVETIRLAADYSCEPPPLVDATAAVEKAVQFVAAIRGLIGAAAS
jgi:uncharacterized protein (UPF0332 family)